MSKRMRQQAILDIVQQQQLTSQAALARELKLVGFDVTQATLSRDIAELSLVKSKDGYSRPEDAVVKVGGPIPDPEGALQQLVLKIDEADNMVVVREAYVDFHGETTTKEIEMRVRQSQGG